MICGAIVQASKLFFLPLLLLSLGLTSCVQNAPKSYAAINGNWHLAGEQGIPPNLLTQAPLLTFAIGVDGNKIYASGNVGGKCSDGLGEVIGVMSLSGQIASDGTFMLANSSPLDSIQISIKGKVPAEGATTWAGSYVISNPAAGTSCVLNASSDFVADLYPPLNGTYSGTISSSSLGSGIKVTVQITQGAITSSLLTSSLQTVYGPLTGTIAVSGSPTLTSGTTVAGSVQALSNSLKGDTLILTYQMNDGSKFTLSGWVSNPSESTLQIQDAAFSGIRCSGTLTKQ